MKQTLEIQIAPGLSRLAAWERVFSGVWMKGNAS